MQNSYVPVSASSEVAYGNMLNSLTTKDENKQAACILSLSNPTETKEYFQWIVVPTGRATYQTYVLQYFKDYVSRYIDKIPDPMKIYPDLRFMITRMNRLLSLSPDVSNLSTTSITQEFKEDIANSFFGLYNNQKNINNLSDLTILINIQLLEQLGLLYTKFVTSDEANQYLIKNKAQPKNYLIRTSTQGNKDGSGDCTVFAISYINNIGKVYHVRYMDVHGVGIYGIDAELNEKIKLVLKNSNIHEFLTFVNYRPADFACIADCLLFHDNLGHINIKHFVYEVYE